MSNLSLDSIKVTRNEPRMHPASGFLSLPSVAMRLAPEILILELFRDVFFPSKRDENSQTRELAPDLRDKDNNLVFGDGERAVIFAFRGRRKQAKQSREDPFFAPAYPGLAAHAWLSKNRERVVARLLFNGAFAQHLWGSSDQSAASTERQRNVIELMVAALSGTVKKHKSDGQEYADILAACLPDQGRTGDTNQAQDSLRDLTGSTSKTVFRADKDELAARIFHDFEVLCHTESTMPRLLWLRLMMTYLRFALPMWLLAQMRITVLTHGWMLQALNGGTVPDDTTILAALATRNRGLIRPTLTPSGEVPGRIRQYIRCRVELNVMLYVLEQLRPQEIGQREITTTTLGKTKLKLSDLLLIAQKASKDLAEDPLCKAAGSPATFVARQAERFPAWRDPLSNGQGKNIDEFLRVLYRAERGDEAGGHLLVRQGRGDSAGFRVFPGQMLLQTVALLAARAKQGSGNGTGGGRLVLRDIEDHFEEYGINFSLAAEARPLLMAELQSLGLLAGSPDAGSSVAVTSPY